jgi:hypothetical protein
MIKFKDLVQTSVVFKVSIGKFDYQLSCHSSPSGELKPYSINRKAKGYRSFDSTTSVEVLCCGTNNDYFLAESTQECLGYQPTQFPSVQSAIDFLNDRE